MFKKLIFLTSFVLVLSLVGNAGAQGTGTIMREVWEGIDGVQVEDLTGNTNYPDNPTWADELTSLEAPEPDLGSNFGSRLHGWLHPETSGDYTFWIAADDGCDLLLSTSDNPADAVKIAGHTSWTGSRAWDNMESQKSDPVSLVAGEKYYISALYKEGSGGDNLSVAWEGPDCPARDVIDGYFLSPAPWAVVLLKASAPVPADGAVDADVATLEWTAGPTTVSHKVYLSTDETIDESDLAAETEMVMHFETLTPGTAYYWRVDEVEADGNVIEGNLWSFTTLPLEAHFPSPSDGGMWIRLDSKLNWTPGKNTIMHNVSFGTDPAVLLPVSMMQMDTSYDPGVLLPATTYYWKVDEFTPIGTIAGPVWSFSTLDPDVGGCVAEYWTNRYFIGAPYLVTIESEVNWDFNADRGSQPHPDVPVIDNFTCRWTAELQVPVTGTYTLYEASDDGARMFLNGEQVAAGWWDRGTTEDTTGPLELVAGERYLLVMEMYEAGGGASAYLRWEGPGIPKQIIPQGALMPPEMAISPLPANGAEEAPCMPVLSWIAGETAILHDVYLGTDADAVAAGDASVYQGQQAEATFVPAEALDLNTTYYWKVDEMTTAMTVVPGLVWSFTVPDYIVIETQETTLDYDNSVEPFVSEAAWDTPADLTVVGVSDLTLRFHGAPAPEGSASIDEATGTYSITGSGADIWGTSDQFHYAYRELTGDATMIARVADNGSGTNEWAKGGVMIRQSLDAGSNHTFMPITAGGGNGASFQGRSEADASSWNNDSGEAVAPPYWVKLERVGNDFSGFISPDGVTWTQLGGVETVVMEDPVLIGLAVTSHVSGELRTFTFDNVDIVGNISADSASQDIGIPGNSAEPIYVALEDSAGVVGVVTHPDPAATQIDQWSIWKIPLSDFSDAGVDLTAAAKLYIGVGDVANPTAGGSGSIRIDDIRVIKPYAYDIMLISDCNPPDVPEGDHEDDAMVAWLESLGYKVDTSGMGQAYREGEAPFDDLEKVVALEAARIVLVTRRSSSGSYDNDRQRWNELGTPLLLMSGYITRGGGSNRWGWTTGGSGDADLAQTVVDIPGYGAFSVFDWSEAPTPGEAPKGVYLPNSSSEIVPGATLVGEFGADRPFLIVYPAGTDFDAGQTEGGPYGIAGADRAFVAHWGYDFDLDYGEGDPRNRRAQWDDFITDDYKAVLETVIDTLILEPVPELVFAEDFESYAAGSDLHGQAGWKGWNNDAGAGAPASDALAFSGLNSVEIIGSADLVQEFDLAGGMLEFSAMQYIPSGTTGTTYFILLNSYDDGANQDWSVQTTFDLAAGTIGFWHGGEATILYDQWVELKYIIDLDNNTVDKYYNGELIVTDQWDDNVNGTLGAIDLYGNNASSVYYDDITIARP